MKFRIVLFIILGAVMIAVATHNNAIGLLASGVDAEPHVPDRTATSRQVVRWSLEQWTGDDTPYQAIRKDIDDKVARGTDPAQLRRESWAQAEKHPQDSQVQFLWAYCASRTIAHDRLAIPLPASAFMMKLQTTSLMVYQLSRAPDPETYDYSRLLYLGLPDDEYNLTMFGERLLRQNTNDNEVKYHLVGDYASQVSLIGFHTKRVPPALQNRALELAHQLVSSSPKNASYWATLGSVYLGVTDISHSTSDMKKAIVAYRKYLQLAPEDDEFDSQAKAIIKSLQDQIANNP